MTQSSSPNTGKAGKRPSKFGNRRVEIDGLWFDSAKEGARWQQLQLLQRAGQITDLVRQTTYRLEVNGQLICKYRPDFEYVEAGERVTEDVKGVITPEFKIKQKLMEAVHGVVIRLT